MKTTCEGRYQFVELGVPVLPFLHSHSITMMLVCPRPPRVNTRLPDSGGPHSRSPAQYPGLPVAAQPADSLTAAPECDSAASCDRCFPPRPVRLDPSPGH